MRRTGYCVDLDIESLYTWLVRRLTPNSVTLNSTTGDVGCPRIDYVRREECLVSGVRILPGIRFVDFVNDTWSTKLY